MRYKKIRKFKRIRIQPLCDKHLSWIFYLFIRRNENFHYKIKSLFFIIYKGLDIKSLGACLYETLLCVRKRKKTCKKFVFVIM
jgi:hypothetical protein